jgi:cytochrome c553
MQSVLVRAVVAVALAGFTVAGYAQGDAATGKAKAAPCAACHGVDGGGGGDPSWPKLAGQFPEYLVEQLEAFKKGERKNPLMTPQAAKLSEQDMQDLAAYYASQPLKPGAAATKELVQSGGRLYRGGNAQTGVPACMSCHGPAGRGIPPHFPRVTGQNAAYTAKQLADFRNNQRADEHGIMNPVAARLTEAEIKAVSEYMAGLH